MAILRLRPDVDKEHKEMFLDIVNMKRNALRMVAMKDNSNKVYFAARTLPLVFKFIGCLKVALVRSKEIKREQDANFSMKRFFTLTNSDLLVG